ncbi:MAG: RusA family crossover junction endodeoxyribonuclease, partial [Proteobacteria bacterium]|nr:RusA family crossover junction endodeoxyribonuclease [Pseudomonadota bacterium]
MLPPARIVAPSTNRAVTDPSASTVPTSCPIIPPPTMTLPPARTVAPSTAPITAMFPDASTTKPDSTAKPDADNCAKAVMDALTQLGAFWRDDAQVVELRVWKDYG